MKIKKRADGSFKIVITEDDLFTLSQAMNGYHGFLYGRGPVRDTSFSGRVILALDKALGR